MKPPRTAECPAAPMAPANPAHYGGALLAAARTRPLPLRELAIAAGLWHMSIDALDQIADELVTEGDLQRIRRAGVPAHYCITANGRATVRKAARREAKP